MELFKGCVAFLFQAIWEMKPWVTGADFVYAVFLVKIVIQFLIFLYCLKSSEWITQQKSQAAMPTWNIPRFPASMHCENWLQTFCFGKLYTPLFIGWYRSQKRVWIIFWHKKLRKIQNTCSDVFQCPKEKKKIFIIWSCDLATYSYFTINDFILLSCCCWSLWSLF